MLYPVICVPVRVNGGFHEILTLEELINLWDISPTDDNGPVRIYYISIREYIDNTSSYVCMHGACI